MSRKIKKIKIETKEEKQSDPVKPFLKWVGGKRQLLPLMRPLIRAGYPSFSNQFIEPFIGGGAVFFDLKPSNAIISDFNKELIDCYLCVKNNVNELIDVLKTHVYEKEYYYNLRKENPEQLTLVQRSARMIYLNKSGFNGLFRVNSKGLFNVPFGKYKNPTICNEDVLKAASDALKDTDIKHASFEQVLQWAQKGDFVYFDPPYIPISQTASFTQYQSSGFKMENQEKLACVFEELDLRKVCVMLSNSDVPWMRKRFGKFNINEIKAKRNINSKGSGRGVVGELIITNF